MNLEHVNYNEYFLNLFEKAITLAKKLKLTEDELLKLDVTTDGFDIKQMIPIMFNRYKKFDDSVYELKDKILWIECPNENNEFKSNMIRFLSNYPQYELKFVEHGYNH